MEETLTRDLLAEQELFAEDLLTERLDERAARASLRRQLTALERRLSEAGMPVLATARRNGGPRILGLAQLERVRDDLYARVREAERAAVARDAERDRARMRLEAMLAEPAAHRFEVVSLAELGIGSCGEYRVRPRAGLVGMLAGWWEVKLSSGCPLAGPAAGAPAAPDDAQHQESSPHA
jgi:hypothetical protein